MSAASPQTFPYFGGDLPDSFLPPYTIGSCKVLCPIGMAASVQKSWIRLCPKRFGVGMDDSVYLANICKYCQRGSMAGLMLLGKSTKAEKVVNMPAGQWHRVDLISLSGWSDFRCPRTFSGLTSQILPPKTQKCWYGFCVSRLVILKQKPCLLRQLRLVKTELFW